LGSELREETHNYASLQNKKFFWTDIDELDIRSFEKAEEFVTGNKIDCIINCAAYTAVDKAESEPELAAEINARAVSNLARISKKHNIFLIHVSTDYVFDGSNSKPYLETDKTNPVSAYGKTKLQGEEAVMANASSAIIIRTSWLYSSFGHNFVKTILRVAREKGKLNVVNDQVGNPTYARDLAKAIIEIVSSFRFQELRFIIIRMKVYAPGMILPGQLWKSGISIVKSHLLKLRIIRLLQKDRITVC
jgi:dTDP-4-dehydrorhamnose reductase